MARLNIRQPFDQGKPVMVARPFKASGRAYQVGELFPWRRLSMPWRRVQTLYEQGRITHEGAEGAKDVATFGHGLDTQEPVPSDDQVSEVDESVTDEVTEEDTEETEVFDDLDAIESMNELREIAKEHGAPIKVSKEDQRNAIREVLASKDED